ncbi:MAG: HNH endonuclease [Anaerolineae bacterium]|nr:HNH endonuclease [Anaerolineae bacterium]
MATNVNYPPEWISGAIQARIRQRANYTCEICGLTFDPATNTAREFTDEDGRPLVGHVHHLDHFPPNCADDNLMFLCQTCHIRLHGQGWKPGDEMPLSWGNEPPPWVLRRGLPYRPNPIVASLQDSARYATRKADRAQFLIGLIESQGWISGAVDPLAEMRALLKAALAEYETRLDERGRTAEIPLREQAAQWAADRGFVDRAEALSRSGLTPVEFAAALEQGLIVPEPCPFEQSFIPRYFDPAKLCLDAAAHRALLLTREQAAAYLGVPLAVFERRRREAGIRHAQGRPPGASGPWERLYRKVDVDKLKR